MLDKNGLEITENTVVEIKDAPFEKDNGLFMVEEVWYSGTCKLVKLNSVMAKTKVNTYWPLRNTSKKYARAFNSTRGAATIEVLCPYVEPTEQDREDNNTDNVKFLKRGIRVSGVYCPCYYCKLDDGNIRITAKDNRHLPNDIGEIRNDTNWMWDEVKPDYCILHPEDKYYNKVLEVIRSLST